VSRVWISRNLHSNQNYSIGFLVRVKIENFILCRNVSKKLPIISKSIFFFLYEGLFFIWFIFLTKFKRYFFLFVSLLWKKHLINYLQDIDLFVYFESHKYLEMMVKFNASQNNSNWIVGNDICIWMILFADCGDCGSYLPPVYIGLMPRWYSK